MEPCRSSCCRRAPRWCIHRRYRGDVWGTRSHYSLGCPQRRGETTELADVFGNAGLAVEELPAGDLDGGDVLKIGSTAYVGMGGRTNAGVEALASVIGPRGWDVRPILVTKVLHLKSAVTALPDGTVIGYPLIDDQTLFPSFLRFGRTRRTCRSRSR